MGTAIHCTERATRRRTKFISIELAIRSHTRIKSLISAFLQCWSAVDATQILSFSEDTDLLQLSNYSSLPLLENPSIGLHRLLQNDGCRRRQSPIFSERLIESGGGT